MANLKNHSQSSYFVVAFCYGLRYSLLELYSEIHYSDVKITPMVSQITSVSIVCSSVCSDTDQRKTSKRGVTGLYEGNPPLWSESTSDRWLPLTKVSDAENISISLRHHHNAVTWGSWRINLPEAHCSLTTLFRPTRKQISKLCVGGLCEGNPLVIGVQMASNAKRVSTSWHHDGAMGCLLRMINKWLNCRVHVTLFLDSLRWALISSTITPFVTAAQAAFVWPIIAFHWQQ